MLIIEEKALPTGGFNPQADTKVVSTKEWVIMLLLASIPIVGIVLMFVWAFSPDENENKRNFSKAYLLMTAIGLGLGFIVFLLTFVIIMISSV